MDLHGNVHEVVVDINGATFTGNFGLEYRGIGTKSARAQAETTAHPASTPSPSKRRATPVAAACGSSDRTSAKRYPISEDFEQSVTR